MCIIFQLKRAAHPLLFTNTDTFWSTEEKYLSQTQKNKKTKKEKKGIVIIITAAIPHIR